MDQIRSRSLPERPRRYRFALTPLADAMFQLLIFFMLSTSLTPYSLITLRTTDDGAPGAEAAPAQPGSGTAPTAAPAAPAAPQDVTTWLLGDGVVTMNGQTFEIDQLPELAEAIGSRDTPGSVVIAISPTARVQDVASAMEALEQGEIAQVQITNVDDGGS